MSKRLTIGYILDDTLDVTDGVQQAMLQIGEEMRQQGNDVHYITTKTTRNDIQNIHTIGTSFSTKFNGNSVRTPLPTYRKKIIQLFEKIHFDILHVQMPFSPFFAARVLQYAPEHVVIVGTFHILPYGVFAKVGTRLLALPLRKTLQKIDKAYAVSEPALEFMRDSFSIDGTVLPNPVDYSFFNTFKSNKTSKSFRVVYVGRFDERKGVKQLVLAIESLMRTVKPPIEFIMCGAGPLHKELVATAKIKHLPITFPGFVTNDEKAGYLASADIAIFPSISGESFGIVLTEAMSANAGVTLGGNNPGYASVLHKWPEVLFDAKNPNEIAKSILTFMNDDKLSRRIGKEQHIKVREYDTKRIVKELTSDYHNLLAKRRENHHN